MNEYDKKIKDANEDNEWLEALKSGETPKTKKPPKPKEHLVSSTQQKAIRG